MSWLFSWFYTAPAAPVPSAALAPASALAAAAPTPVAAIPLTAPTPTRHAHAYLLAPPPTTHNVTEAALLAMRNSLKAIPVAPPLPVEEAVPKPPPYLQLIALDDAELPLPLLPASERERSREPKPRYRSSLSILLAASELEAKRLLDDPDALDGWHSPPLRRGSLRSSGSLSPPPPPGTIKRSLAPDSKPINSALVTIEEDGEPVRGRTRCRGTLAEPEPKRRRLVSPPPPRRLVPYPDSSSESESDSEQSRDSLRTAASSGTPPRRIPQPTFAEVVAGLRREVNSAP